MILFWILAYILPLFLVGGFIVMTGSVQLRQFTSNSQFDLGRRIVEMTALVSLMVFLLGLNISTM